ncbi:CxxH/CxxC protein [Salibacterium aidingense]|uniref:CxxH/CxxC protein n=1 Tax=Salibacterium aidingense TaxID=384933 RepID=UPI00042069EB|nr:CxxH/CxxC protein [Salibacterium aidingense]
MYYACEEHSERALDDAVEHSGEPPFMDRMAEDNLSTGCSYCEQKAVYKVQEKRSHQV